LNYLSHFYFNSRLLNIPVDRHWFHWGAAMPDLLRVHRKDHRLRLNNIPQSPDRPASLAFWEGVKNHLLTDRIYHQSELFNEFQTCLIRLFRAQNPILGEFPLNYIAHISQELLLDYILFKHHADLADEFYRAIAETEIPRIADELNILFPGNGSLVPFIRRFTKEKYLNHYGNLEYLIGILFYKVNRLSPKKLSGVFFTDFEIVYNKGTAMIEPEVNGLMGSLLKRFPSELTV